MKIIKANKADIGTSVIGVLILGVGLGALFSDYLSNFSSTLIIIGIVLHSLGMYRLYKNENISSNEQFSLSNLLYWVCWILLIALIVYIIIRRFA